MAPSNNDEAAKFNQRKERALAIVVLAVEPSLLYLLGEPEDPKVVWDTLQGQFQRKDVGKQTEPAEKVVQYKAGGQWIGEGPYP